MPLAITNSLDISSLDFKITANTKDGKFYLDVTPSIFIGSGAAYVEGASFKVVNPLGVVIQNYTTSGYDIAPPMTGEASLNIPKVAGVYLWGTYTITVRLTDQQNNVYEFEKSINLCQVDKKNKNKNTVCINANILGDCVDGKVVITLDGVPNYKGQMAATQVNDLTLYYPTESGLAPLDTVFDGFSVQLYEGEYKFTGDVVALYDYGDNVFFEIKYDVKCSKIIRCVIDECCIYAQLEELNSKLTSDCSNEELAETQGKIFDTLRLLKTINLAASCGNDPSDYIIELESILGCSCSCNCNDGTPIINNTPSTNFSFQGCGFTQTTVGQTKVITFTTKETTLEAQAGQTDIVVSAPTVSPNGCSYVQTISFDSSGRTPKPFAVIGNTRSSKLGNIEFFDTLTLANNSAVSGETVIIYKDTVENLTLKAGVNYEGVGVHSVGNLTGNFLVDGNSCFISNLTFLNLTLTGFTEIDCSNVQFDGVHSLSTNSSVNNAVFIGGSGKSLTCNSVSKLSNCMVYCFSTFVDNINVTNCRFIDKGANVPSEYFVTINNTTGGVSNNIQLIFSHNYIESQNNKGLFLITRGGTDIRSVVSNNTIKTNTQTAAYVHIGGITQNESGTLFSNNTISNFGTESALVLYNVSTVFTDPAKNLSHNSIVGNNAYSVNGAAILSVLCGMKDCHGYSENSYGILIDSQEGKSSEVRIIDCTGESKTSNGLRALRDIYIVGGTYISSKDASDGNPIFISNTAQNSVVNNYYFIAGVKTLAYNASANSIKANVALSAKITRCIFLNERVPLGTAVLGIDTANITLAAITTDAFGNIT
jgi:hypothetical protein